jgi:hypothetical protein
MAPMGNRAFGAVRRLSLVYGKGNGHDVSEWRRQFRGNSDLGALGPQGGRGGCSKRWKEHKRHKIATAAAAM